MHPSDLLTLLSSHIGAANGLTAAQISSALQIPMRHVRRMVTALREEGTAVCGTPSTGYYIAATAEELEATCQYIHSRAMHSLHIESRMRKIPLPDLVGQMKLGT